MNREEMTKDLIDMVEQLCEPHRHSEPLYETDRWGNRKLSGMYRSTQEALLAQLRTIGHEGLRVGSAGPSGNKPESRPPGCFEAFNSHVYIAAESGKWCDLLGIPARKSVEDGIRGLLGVAPNLEDSRFAKLVREVRYWHRQAAINSGRDLSPYVPPVRCPSCSKSFGLRVSYTDQGPRPRVTGAYCINRDRQQNGDLVCGSAWDEDAMGDLVDYIRHVTSEKVAC